MIDTPTDDQPGFVAEKPEQCFACFRLIRPMFWPNILIRPSRHRLFAFLAITHGVSDFEWLIVERMYFFGQDSHRLSTSGHLTSRLV